MGISGSDPIRDLSHSLLGLQKTDGPRQEPNERTGKSGGPQGETVAFSPELQEFDQIVNDIQALPDIRADRIQAIQNALAQGEYQVNGDLVARGLIEEIVFDAVV